MGKAPALFKYDKMREIMQRIIIIIDIPQSVKAMEDGEGNIKVFDSFEEAIKLMEDHTLGGQDYYLLDLNTLEIR